MFERQTLYFGGTLKTFNMKHVIVPKIFNCRFSSAEENDLFTITSFVFIFLAIYFSLGTRPQLSTNKIP